jgi:hypothetical protein
MKTTEIVDVVYVNNVMKVVKAKGWGSCWQTMDRGGWEFITTNKEAGSPRK